ncbi:MAG: ABC transporter ATP-binding protein, partial [Chloroflexi bacterium]
MNPRTKKFLSYYKPYLGMFFADIACAIIVSAITLILPLCIRDVTKNVLATVTPNTVSQSYTMRVILLVLVAIHTACNIFVSYQGHVMGA